MRIVRFSPLESAHLGSDPLYGVLNDQDKILVLKGDPIYAGIVPTEKVISLDELDYWLR
jgi:hypothetical protein